MIDLIKKCKRISLRILLKYRISLYNYSLGSSRGPATDSEGPSGAPQWNSYGTSHGKSRFWAGLLPWSSRPVWRPSPDHWNFAKVQNYISLGELPKACEGLRGIFGSSPMEFLWYVPLKIKVRGMSAPRELSTRAG